MNITRRQVIIGGSALMMGTPGMLLAQTKQLRLGILTPNGHPWNVAAEKVAASLKEQTNGRLNLTVFASGQLGNEGAMLQQMQSGALDMGWINGVVSINLPAVKRRAETLGTRRTVKV